MKRTTMDMTYHALRFALTDDRENTVTLAIRYIHQLRKSGIDKDQKAADHLYELIIKAGYNPQVGLLRDVPPPRAILASGEGKEQREKEIVELRKALAGLVELWDATHPNDPCGCVGASDDCKHPPPCELCIARAIEGDAK